MTAEDASNGYEAAADQFMAVRSPAGTDVVRAWAASLPTGACVVDVGAGHGEPLTAILLETGLQVSAIDAAPSLVAAFRLRFPGVEIACEPAERSAFFGRIFDAALMVGLIFLLPKDRQGDLIGALARAIRPGGRVLVSAPWQVGSWADMLTGRTSWSLGSDAYGLLFRNAGFDITETHTDEGGTHYYDLRRT